MVVVSKSKIYKHHYHYKLATGKLEKGHTRIFSSWQKNAAATGPSLLLFPWSSSVAVTVVKGDFGGLLGEVHILGERTVELVFLLFHVRTELQQCRRHLSPSLSQHVHELARPGLVPLMEERVRDAALARPAGAPDAVHVVLDGQREAVVDHHLHVRDVQPAGRHVGRDQDRHLLLPEVLQGGLARTLALVSVDGPHLPAGAPQVPLQPRALLLVQAEDDHAVAPVVVPLQQLLQPRAALALAHHLHALRDAGVGRQLGPADRHAHGPGQELRRQLAHLPRPRRREHGRAPPPRRRAGRGAGADDRAHVLLEPQVQHAVRLVQHQMRYTAQVNGVFAHQVSQPPGGGHHHVSAALRVLKLPLLLVLGHAAVDADAAQPRARPRRLDHRRALLRQLARGADDQHQRAGPLPAEGLAAAQLPVDPRQRGQGEGQRLPGARLGHADQVAPGRQDRPALGLDGRRRGEPLAAAQHLRGEPRLAERLVGRERGGALVGQLDPPLRAPGRHGGGQRGRGGGGRRASRQLPFF
mmetsp:Transcript_43735/g.71603  ORF Transcript_43735/g.71603 Transcript_43735/m.71603 type:complete len:526 (-) Transcript_43735:254-1831(-)